MKIGVIIGRFQTPYLHKGHKALISYAQSDCDKLIIMLGVAHVKAEPSDGLDFVTRRLMLAENYPNALILPVFDNKSDEKWSQVLDEKLKTMFPYDTIQLYGSRGCFINRYSGKLTCEEYQSPNPEINATEIREQTSQQPISSSDFRKGVIYSTMNRFPISYTTTDTAIIDFSNRKILLGRKPAEDKWRFPGGFVDPTDETLELAAKREVMEEATGIETDNYHYICSKRIKDWRYKGRIDQIITTFFVATYISGHAKAGDDLAEVKWFDFDQFIGLDNLDNYQQLVEEHCILMVALTNPTTLSALGLMKETKR